MPDTMAAAGSVRNHAVTMLPATPQRTAEKRFVYLLVALPLGVH